MKVTKKIFAIVTVALVAILLVACSSSNFKVKFNSNGGSVVTELLVAKNKLAYEPADPTKDPVDGKKQHFTGWFLDSKLTKPYDFTARVNKNVTLYAGWSSNAVVRLNTKSPDNTMLPVELGVNGGTVNKPADPVREGFKFGGWFNGKAGLTWLETSALTFPFTVTDSVRLHAYWEPLNSVSVTYSAEETYTSSLTSDSSLILNPLVYRWNHEDALISNLVTPLYSTEVDWDKAINDGVADAPADFSKIGTGEGKFSIDALDYQNILVGAASFPKDSEGNDFLVDGKYDRDIAARQADNKWSFTLRSDLKFQDGTPIDAYTFEYSLQQYLSKTQNNYRATLFYRNDVNKNGRPIVNSEAYFKGEVAWDQVGFKVDSEDKYTFTVETSVNITQAAAVSLANAIRLVHPTKYAESLDATGANSKYGTPSHPYVSYGAYVLKSWDENQKLVLNKNYDYVAKGTINYKSLAYQIVDNVDQRMQLYEKGELSVTGLSQDYYAKYAEDPKVKKSWDGYPQYLVINTADAKDNGAARQTALYNKKFRQALLYGFDRLYYANSVYAPNTASILPIPLDTKSYLNDTLYYSQSPAHLELLASLGIDPKTEGYLPEKAKTLFADAYSEWLAEGNSGKIVVKLLIENDDFSQNLGKYIKDAYEKLFGADKLEISLDTKDGTGVTQFTKNWDFDMILASVGFGSSTGAFYQIPAFAFLGSLIGGGDLGLSHPFDGSLTNIEGNAAYIYEELEIDLTSTYTYLKSLSADKLATLPGHALMLGWLEESTDPETGDVKLAGIYKGDVYTLGLYLLGGFEDDTVYDGGPAAPFDGATEDTWAIAAAFEKVFLDYATLVPTVTRSSATLYASSVTIEWPAYSVAFDWGAARYRYLNTDPDFR